MEKQRTGKKQRKKLKAFDIEQIKQEDKKSKRKKKFVDVEMMEANADEQLEIKKQREERKTKKRMVQNYMENMAQSRKYNNMVKIS